MDAASKSRVDDVRELIIEGVKYSPVRGRYKIYIIDEVQMFSASAFDALLKTIEEPPKSVIFVFATTEPHKVPPTILSRCQRFDFRRIAFDDLVKYIKAIAKKEKIKISDDAVYIVARKADGSARDCLSLLDQVIAYGGDEVTKESVEKTLGLVDQETLFELSDIIAKKEAEKGIALLNTLVDSGTDIPEFVSSLLDHLRNILVAKAGGDSEKLFDLSRDYIKKYRKEADRFSDTDILRMISIVGELANSLRKTSEPKIHLEVALMKLIRMESSVNLEDVIRKLELLRGGGDSGTNPTSKGKKITDPEKQEKNETRTTSSVPSTEKPNLNLQTVKEGWEKLLSEVKKKKLSLWTCLVEGEPTEFDGRHIGVEFHNGRRFHKFQVERKENKELIENMLDEIYNFPLRLRFTLDEKKDKPFKQGKTGHRQKKKIDIEKIKESDPMIKNILDNFQGDILDRKEL
jgi:DNA polymerase-3 subunit gamma/tau